jgi:hypothetical protein
VEAGDGLAPALGGAVAKEAAAGVLVETEEWM